MKVARRKSGFTLIELLVVISILGILAALVVPALKNIGKSNLNVSASRQLLDGIGRARQLAISQRTTVYMVFLPTNFWTIPPGTIPGSAWWTALNLAQRMDVTNLCDKQLSGYTYIAYGAAGDQPGRHGWHYLATWQSLPDGTFIAAQKFAGTNRIAGYVVPPFSRSTASIPFPQETSAGVTNLPCIAFNYLGQLTLDGQNLANRDEYIPLAKGSVSYGVDATKAPQLSVVAPNDITESPPGNSTNSSYNLIDIDPLTGRATLRYQKVQ